MNIWRTLGTAAFVLLAVAAHSQSNWTGATSSDWAQAANWTGGVPATGTNGVLNTVAPNPTVVNGISANVSTLTVGQIAIGSLTITGGGVLHAANSIVLGSAGGGSGNLTVLSSGVANVNDGAGGITLGNAAASFGTLNIGASAGAAPAVPGLLNVASVNGGVGTASVVFNHTDPAYAFTNNGAVGGLPIVISGSALVRHEAGVTTFTGINTYVGGTLLNGGTLLLNNASGSGAGNGTITVAIGATLAGSGGTAGHVTLYGTISPGASLSQPGSIATFGVGGILVWNAGGTMALELG